MPGNSTGEFGTPPNPGGLCGQGWVVANAHDGPGRGHIYYLASVLAPMESIDVRFSRSTDGGVTWLPSVRVNDNLVAGNSYHWFGMMSVAPNGRIDAVWNDTRNSGQANLSELYYSYSTDAGETWSVNEPVSPMFDSHLGWPSGQQKIGDYYHMISDNLGVNVAYAATFNGEQDIYFLRIGPWDCNGNEVDDAVDIAGHSSHDCNANDVPDECEYRADVDGDGFTTLNDHSVLIHHMTGPADGNSLPAFADGFRNSSGQPAAFLQPHCLELLDPDHDGDTDLNDFAYLQRVFVAE